MPGAPAIHPKVSLEDLYNGGGRRVWLAADVAEVLGSERLVNLESVSLVESRKYTFGRLKLGKGSTFGKLRGKVNNSLNLRRPMLQIWVL